MDQVCVIVPAVPKQSEAVSTNARTESHILLRNVQRADLNMQVIDQVQGGS